MVVIGYVWPARGSYRPAQFCVRIAVPVHPMSNPFRPTHVKPFPPKPRFKWYIQNTPAEALPQTDPRNLGIHERDVELQIEDGVFVLFAGSDGNLFELDDRCGQCSNIFVFAGSGFFRVCAPPLFAAAVADLEATIGRLILSSSSSSSKKDSSSTPFSNAPPSLSSSSSSSSSASSS